ncbi:hypothetical protein ACJRO7_035571 [Eucalyptus globulus]|uniref:Uncharacterized protein n=1 Tax=Eucalyptus globulus TaxID=34317 RepID=A0ABD3J988_EUCGL
MAASACNRAMQRASTSLGPALKSGVRSSPQLGFASPRFPLPSRLTSPDLAGPRPRQPLPPAGGGEPRHWPARLTSPALASGLGLNWPKKKV